MKNYEVLNLKTKGGIVKIFIKLDLGQFFFYKAMLGYIYKVKK